MKKRRAVPKKVGCVSCGTTVRQSDRAVADEEVAQCRECYERSRERPGADYDPAELGGEG